MWAIGTYISVAYVGQQATNPGPGAGTDLRADPWNITVVAVDSRLQAARNAKRDFGRRLIDN
jgi:hypothetical protein